MISSLWRRIRGPELTARAPMGYLAFVEAVHLHLYLLHRLPKLGILNFLRMNLSLSQQISLKYSMMPVVVSEGVLMTWISMMRTTVSSMMMMMRTLTAKWEKKSGKNDGGRRDATKDNVGGLWVLGQNLLGLIQPLGMRFGMSLVLEPSTTGLWTMTRTLAIMKERRS